MRKFPATATEDLLEVMMRRHERASMILTSNRSVDDWGKLLGDKARGNGASRSAAAPRTRAHLWSAQLAHKTPCGARIRGHHVQLTSLGCRRGGLL